jgi:hypothetical protein
MKAVICEESARLCRQVYRERLRAVVLAGSLARDEGTFVETERGRRLLGDAELLLVFDDGITPPPAADLALIRDQIEARLRRRGLRAEIALSAVGRAYLRRLPPSIFAYELRASGEAVAGEASVLGLIPKFPAADIPREDAWRMLANRLVEQLAGTDELLDERAILSPEAHYRTVKLYLDMTTSLLVFAGAYAPTYGERADNLARLAKWSGTTTWPFPLAPFAEQVAAVTRWKLSGGSLVTEARRLLWERAIDYAEALWHWELGRLTDPERADSPAALMALWMRRQPWSTRVRGWAHVVRARGWHRSWPLWPRWLRQASHGSPRHLVYRAASTLVFELRATAGQRRSLSDLRRLARDLPLATWPGQPGRDSLGSLAAAILANYRSFVMETRA